MSAKAFIQKPSAAGPGPAGIYYANQLTYGNGSTTLAQSPAFRAGPIDTSISGIQLYDYGSGDVGVFVNEAGGGSSILSPAGITAAIANLADGLVVIQDSSTILSITSNNYFGDLFKIYDYGGIFIGDQYAAAMVIDPSAGEIDFVAPTGNQAITFNAGSGLGPISFAGVCYFGNWVNDGNNFYNDTGTIQIGAGGSLVYINNDGNGSSYFAGEITTGSSFVGSGMYLGGYSTGLASNGIQGNGTDPAMELLNTSGTVGLTIGELPDDNNIVLFTDGSASFSGGQITLAPGGVGAGIITLGGGTIVLDGDAGNITSYGELHVSDVYGQGLFVNTTYGAGGSLGIGLLSTGGTPRFTVSGYDGNAYFAGNVGIGFTSPLDPLVIMGANDGTPILRLTNDSGGITDFTFTRDATFGYLAIQGNQVGANNIILAPTSGNIGIGTASPNANALLDISSTTKAFIPPRMTTTQKNAIASPTGGMVVWDSTLGKLCVYGAASWETITSI